VLSFFQPTIWEISRPGVLSWLGAVDVLGVLVFYGWVIRSGRLLRRIAEPVDRSREPAIRPAS